MPQPVSLTDPPTSTDAGAPGSPPAAALPPAAPPQPPVVVKKYANRRLYNTETSSYITLDNLADMIRAGRDFVVYDAKSGEDITRGVLTQIIVEEESKGTSMLPTAFLRQLIGFYGGSLQGVVPRYLEQAMSSFARQQSQLRQVVQQTFIPFMPAGVEEMGRQNMAMIERAMSMFNPFHRGSEPLPPAPDASALVDAAQQLPGAHASDTQAHDARAEEMHRLQSEVESLRGQLAAARAMSVMVHAPVPVAVPVETPANLPPALSLVEAPKADTPGAALSEPPLSRGPATPLRGNRRDRGPKL